MSKNKITGREMERDAAEAWLAKNDPDYATEKKNWQTPSTDALARDRKIHPSLTEVSPLDAGANDGNYRRRPKASGRRIGQKFENAIAVESDVDKD